MRSKAARRVGALGAARADLSLHQGFCLVSDARSSSGRIFRTTKDALECWFCQPAWATGSRGPSRLGRAGGRYFALLAGFGAEGFELDAGFAALSSFFSSFLSSFFASSAFWNFFGSASAHSAAHDEMLTRSLTPVAWTQRLEPSAVEPTFTSRFAPSFNVITTVALGLSRPRSAAVLSLSAKLSAFRAL